MSSLVGPEGRSFRPGVRRRGGPRPGRSRGGAYVAVRATGLALAVLVLGHFALTHVITDVAAADASFIATRWSSALWVAWDIALLATALGHGAAGVWIAVEDYSPDPVRRRRRLRALVATTVALLVIGLGTMAVAI